MGTGPTVKSQRHRSDGSNVTVEETIPLDGIQQTKSCLVRAGSSASRSASIRKKHVNYNDSTELIPAHFSGGLNGGTSTSPPDDDEVFSDSVAPQLPRGDMCAPYIRKRGSMPGLVALPDWFGLETFREEGGTQEPPVTPVGRDELALKRHRFFSEILSAAQAAQEHRVRFNPLGPNVATVNQEEAVVYDGNVVRVLL